MIVLCARFAALLFTGLASGATLCVLLVEPFLGSSGSFYVEYKQMMIRALTVPLPLLGMLGSAAALVDSYLRWRSGVDMSFFLTVGAVMLGVVAGALTKAGHFPINATITTWDRLAPPSDWGTVRARWTTLHRLRTGVVFLAFVLLIIANLLPTAAINATS